MKEGWHFASSVFCLMHVLSGFLESHHGHCGLTEHHGKKTGNNVADGHADRAVDGRGVAHGIGNAKDKVFEGKADDRFCYDVHKGCLLYTSDAADEL